MTDQTTQETTTPTPTGEGSGRTEPFAPRTYKSAWQHREDGCAVLLTAEEWLEEEAEVYATLDAAAEDDLDRDPERAGIMRAIAKEIATIRAEKAQWAEAATKSAPSPTAARGVTGLPAMEELTTQLQQLAGLVRLGGRVDQDPEWTEEERREVREHERAAAAKFLATLRPLLSAAEQGARDREDAERWRALRRESPEMAAAAERMLIAAPKLRAARQPRQEGDR